MKLKQFNEWNQELISYWTEKLDNPPQTGTPWRQYDNGPLWSNQSLLKSQVLSSLSIFQNEFDVYYSAIQSGVIFSEFKLSLLTMFSFVSMREGMKFVGVSDSFAIDQVEFSTCEDWFSWYSYDLTPKESSDVWFTTIPTTADPSIADLIINSSIFNDAASAISNRVSIDIINIKSLESIIQSTSNEKLIYQIYTDPPPLLLPPKKPLKDIIFYDYKVKDVISEFNWNIKGIT